MNAPGSPEGPKRIKFYFDEEPIEAYEGQSVAIALWAAGRRSLRKSVRLGEPRGMLCGMGTCQECVIDIDGRRREACLTLAQSGLFVKSVP